MNDDDVIRASAVQRLAFADLFESLTPDQLATQSLCGQWDVALVGAHLSAAITTKLVPFLVLMARNGGSFDRANDANARRAADRGIPAVITTIRQNADSRFAPPLSGLRAPLTDVLVHTGDVARPLGLPHDAPSESVRTALEFLQGPVTVGFVSRGSLSGLRFIADDLGTEYGRGEEVRGRGIDVMMAMCGRIDALNDLQGPGVDILRRRLSHP